ncbi:hypothetical protein CUJ83_14785 [Methanocella sp. CWC-04]|uniref:Exonuclease domain-containing protein n=1 Tax=Methanooceanicella nereidis TaxID=2052831 RepID=A0AAP2REU6_9EURY|nr:3'-5' exonuclease [Methanocella sp. CWC-04]MCD1296266.1 hypothetical protein [Methanocella sp. CWC-04]
MVILSVIDTETTGLGIFNRGCPCHDDHAISLGMVIADVDVDTRNIKCLDSMYSLICIPDPSRAEDTYMIHGIRSEEIEKAPSPAEVCEIFLGMRERYGFQYAGAWNHEFDKYFIRRTFKLSGLKKPALNWVEMQPRKFAKLDHYVSSVIYPEIKGLAGHNALNDCLRALGVYATLGGMELDMSLLKGKALP